MYRCESWTIKKAERWRIDASNCDAGEDSPESLGLQGDQTSQSQRKFIGRTDAEADVPIVLPRDVKSWHIEKTLMLGKIVDGKRRGWQRMRWLNGIPDSMDTSLGNSESWWWTGRPGVLRFRGSQRVGLNWTTELNWWKVVCLKAIFKCFLWVNSYKAYRKLINFLRKLYYQLSLKGIGRVHTSKLTLGL